MERKREGIVKEMIETERNYVGNLNKIIKYFLDPLLGNSESENPFISLVSIRSIFSEIKVLYGLNQRFLTELESLKTNDKLSIPIGSTFVKMGPFFKWYQSYVCNYDKAYSTFTKLKQESVQFSSFIDEAESNPDLKFMDLPSLLVQPIQRIPQYKLLLVSLSKYTGEDHPDSSATIKAVKIIEDVGYYINEKKREAENVAKVIGIGETITGFPNLAMPYRRFCMQDKFNVMNSLNGVNEIQIFAFNDIILVFHLT